jgi:hypothetical protein
MIYLPIRLFLNYNLLNSNLLSFSSFVWYHNCSTKKALFYLGSLLQYNALFYLGSLLQYKAFFYFVSYLQYKIKCGHQNKCTFNISCMQLYNCVCYVYNYCILISDYCVQELLLTQMCSMFVQCSFWELPL